MLAVQCQRCMLPELRHGLRAAAVAACMLRHPRVGNRMVAGDNRSCAHKCRVDNLTSDTVLAPEHRLSSDASAKESCASCGVSVR